MPKIPWLSVLAPAAVAGLAWAYQQYRYEGVTFWRHQYTVLGAELLRLTEAEALYVYE